MKKLLAIFAMCVGLSAPASAEVQIQNHNTLDTQCTVNIWDEIFESHFSYWWPYVNNNLYNTDLVDGYSYSDEDPNYEWLTKRACLVKALQSFHDDLNQNVNVTVKHAGDFPLIGLTHAPPTFLYGSIPGTAYVYITNPDNNQYSSYATMKSLAEARMDLILNNHPFSYDSGTEGFHEDGGYMVTYTITKD